MDDWTYEDTINELTCMLSALSEKPLNKREQASIDAIYDRVHALEIRVSKRLTGTVYDLTI